MKPVPGIVSAMNQKADFNPGFFRGNRDVLRDSLHFEAPVIVTAHGLLQRSHDTTFPFSQDRNFWYLTGLDEPNLSLVIAGPSEFLILPEADATRDIFDGAIDLAALSSSSGIAEIMNYRDGWRRVYALARKANAAHICQSSTPYQKMFGFYVNPARRALMSRLRRHVPGIKLFDVRAQLAFQRQHKQTAEIAAINRAVAITTESFDEISRNNQLKRYGYEYELEAAIGCAFRNRGAQGHAYAPIVAAGNSATTLHYTLNESEIQTADLLVVDAGAEYSNYAADITRTITQKPLQGRRKDIYDAVVSIQKYAVSLLKPGVFLRDFEAMIVAEMGVRLQELGLVVDPADTEQVRKYYPHATSHFLGLDVHDVGDYRLSLAPDMVLTCEPGIYVPEEGIGVRIEDDILITSDGNQNMSANCSYEAYRI